MIQVYFYPYKSPFHRWWYHDNAGEIFGVHINHEFARWLKENNPKLLVHK